MAQTGRYGGYAPVCGAVATLVLTACSAQAAFPPQRALAALEARRLTDVGTMGVEPLRTAETARMGGPWVVGFRVAERAPFDRVVAVSVVDEGTARVADAGRVLAGETLGYAVLEPGAPGRTVVLIGTSEIALTVSPATGPMGMDRPRVTAPADGAAAWGTFGVSVSWWRPGAEPRAIPALRVGEGQELTPEWVNAVNAGPLGVAYFAVDGAALPEGPSVLRVEVAGRDGQRLRGESVGLRVLHPEVDALIAGECEAVYDLPPLPEGRKEPAARARDDQKASGGRFFDNAGSQPRFRFPVDVPEGRPGWYQVMLTGAGDPACGTLAAVGVTVDEADRPRTRSAIASAAWHRTPIGTPVRLEPGRRVLRLDFLNDFHVGGAADRNLRLDRVEVLRVADAGGSAPAAPGAMMAAAAAPPGEMMMMSGGAAGGAPGAGWPESAGSRERAGGLRLAFARPIDGAEVAGDLEVRAAVRWPGMVEAANWGRTPRITLMLNDQPLATQRSLAPRFVVPWAAMARGENRVRLVGQAAGSGERVLTPEHRVLRPGLDAGSAHGVVVPVQHRLTVHEPVWDAVSRGLMTGEGSPPEKLCFGMYSEGLVELALPEGLAGLFEIDLEAKGQAFDGPPVLELALLRGEGGAAQRVGALRVAGSWEPQTVRGDEAGRAAAVLGLEAGPKSLRLSFVNDRHEPGKGDRNVFVQAVVLRPCGADRFVGPPTGAAASSGLPSAAMLYPPRDGAAVRAGGAGAVVLRSAGESAPASAQVLIDGEPVGPRVDLRRRLGPYLVPIPLRGVAPGRRMLAVRTIDAAGRAVTTPGRAVEVVADTGGSESAGGGPANTGPTEYERAVLLLDRFGFGPDERELAAVLTMGVEAYLRDRLTQGAEAPGVAGAADLAAVRYADSRSGGDVPRRAVMEALLTPNPVRARFVLWAQNHFSTWMRKAEARRKADEHARFARLGVAPFGELLMASATSPAMLVYLDQAQSFSRRLNENYAREIMELHTLGVRGGYSQADVTALAHILTGWTLAREPVPAGGSADGLDVSGDDYGLADTFRYDPALGDEKARTFLGRRFPAAGAGDRHARTLTAVGMLAGHPSTAAFVSRKLAEHYLSHPAPSGVVEELASAFTRTGGDMVEVLLTLARRPEFWSATAGARATHPPEFALRLSRCARAADAGAVVEYLNLSGHGMFDRATPDGYQEDDAGVMDSNAMLQRWKFAGRVAGSGPMIELLPPELRTGDKPYADDEPQKMVDLLALRLTGRLLGEASNAAALALFGQTEGRRDERCRVLAGFVACTPEVQVK